MIRKPWRRFGSLLLEECRVICKFCRSRIRLKETYVIGRVHAGIKHTHVTTKDIFYLLLLEATSNNKSTCTVNTSWCTHFSKKKSYDMLGLHRTSKLYCQPFLSRWRRTWRCIFLQISVTLAKIDFLFPSRKICGGAMVYRLLDTFDSSEGLAACRAA